MGSRLSGWRRLKYAVAGRQPPDPELFPNYMQNAQHMWLRFSEWWPHGDGRAATSPADLKGVVFMVAGLGEHTGRYDSIALRLNREGYVAFAMDNQGAGGSDGDRLYVERFEHFVDDVCAFVKFIQQRYPALKERPTFLLGHSMGGLISTRVVQRDASPFRGVILSGPALGLTDPPSSWLVAVGRSLSKWAPKTPVHWVKLEDCTNNPLVYEEAQRDPYYLKLPVCARLADEMLTTQKKAASDIGRFTFPFLIVHGKEDKLCSPEKSKWAYEQAPSKDKHLKLYNGAAHEVLTEVCRQDVLNDVMKFINDHAK